MSYRQKEPLLFYLRRIIPIPTYTSHRTFHRARKKTTSFKKARDGMVLLLSTTQTMFWATTASPGHNKSFVAIEFNIHRSTLWEKSFTFRQDNAGTKSGPSSGRCVTIAVVVVDVVGGADGISKINDDWLSLDACLIALLRYSFIAFIFTCRSCPMNMVLIQQVRNEHRTCDAAKRHQSVTLSSDDCFKTNN